MTTDPARTWIRRTSTAAGLAYTAIAEYELARRLGAQQPIAVMLPLALDCYVIAALKWFRAFDVALSLILMCAAQVAAHALDAGVVRVNLELVTVVSVLVPVALWRTHALARDEDDVPAESVAEFAAAVERVPVPATAPPVPEAYPAIAVRVPAVPAAVPPGVRLLPIVARPAPAPVAVGPVVELPVPEPAPAHEYPVPDAQVHLDWQVPDDYADKAGNPTEPTDEDTPYPDPLIPQVRTDFPGEVPGVRRLKETYSIGQGRAQRIRDELTGVRS
ncbi:hypothetical protein [Streptomyces sp. SID12501]|uniref:DUF2637 domain-containing protein n=1 Tax=Streptomyces sp. SID12501 TaxID=2706042 RepID=A0A6B3C1D2_9ACTN|nr:hypothetical protein [Streptomyces sp. SID12501]NEC90458.1 hypothetical protein [Streptomyces sp. SID12501]